MRSETIVLLVGVIETDIKWAFYLVVNGYLYSTSETEVDIYYMITKYINSTWLNLLLHSEKQLSNNTSLIDESNSKNDMCQ